MDDGYVEIEGHDLKLTLWYHDPGHLRSALCFGGGAEWKPGHTNFRQGRPLFSHSPQGRR
jgi:hypothetical protein